MFERLCVSVVLGLSLGGCASSVSDKASGNIPTNVEKISTSVADPTNNNVKISDHLLDGMTINWSYNSSSSGMLVSFENGLAQYEWITGPRKGRSDQDIPYKSRKIGADIYLINWVQPEKPDFITLIFDFKNNTVFSSGLIGYGTDRQKNLFLDGTIKIVER
ncbi:MAG: hypothetical protein ABJN69_03470 [Hellea sp.]